MYKLWSKRIKSQLKKDLLVKQSSEAAIAGVLKSFAKFTRKHLCQSLFFNKAADTVAGLWAQVFPNNFSKFLRTSILTEHSRDYFYVVENHRFFDNFGSQ